MATQMEDSNNAHFVSDQAIDEGVREAPQRSAPRIPLESLELHRILGKEGGGAPSLIEKATAKPGALSFVPSRRLGEIGFGRCRRR
jgi:hypothetical protein